MSWSSDKDTMTFKVAEDKHTGDWRVESFNIMGGGDCYVTAFKGPDAELRARQYAQACKASAMDKGCFMRAQQRGQQTFTLVAGDVSSPSTICWWILQNIETCPAVKLVDALLGAIAMRDAPNRKNAD